MIRLFKSKSNVGWKGNKPTDVVVGNFEKGFLKPGNSVLDVGCGFGRNANWLALKGLGVIGINVNDDEIQEARKEAIKLGAKVEYLHADAISLPFPNKTFDVVLDLGCSHMLSNKFSQQKAEKEAARVLKPNGYLIFFGFSKKHPSYVSNPGSPKFRDIKDIQDMYGRNFEIISSEETRWRPRPEENAKIREHIGLNVLMQKSAV